MSSLRHHPDAAHPGQASSMIEPKPRKGAGSPVKGPATMADAAAALYDRTNFEVTTIGAAQKHEYKLDRMLAILHALGDPQDQVRTVHVAGTKGKGSTCVMIAGALEACGYTVGLYTSPHLMDVRERIAVNRRPVSEADFVYLTAQVLAAAEAVEPTFGRATFFELITAMGFLHFAQQAVDIAVIEVGLGGLLDCTNVITPEVSLVTAIGRDHTEILGKTVEEIAAQKAGIFKPGVPALTVVQSPGVLDVLRAQAARVNAPFEVVGQDIEFSCRFEHASPESAPQARVSINLSSGEFDFVAVPMAGEHQAFNCGLALAAVDKLSERGLTCDLERAVEGVAHARLPARFEVLAGSPRIVLDGAHNPESVECLMKTLGQYLQYDALIVIFGCAADKDVPPMLRSLAKGADKVIFTQAADNKRAMDPRALAKAYRAVDDKDPIIAEGLPEALAAAKKIVSGGDVLCITGSFYLIGEFKRWLADKQAAEKAHAAAGRAKNGRR